MARLFRLFILWYISTPKTLPTLILFCSHPSKPTQNPLTTFSPLLDTCAYSLWHCDHFHIFRWFKAIYSREYPQSQWHCVCTWRVSNLRHRKQGYIRVLQDLTDNKNHGLQDNPYSKLRFSIWSSVGYCTRIFQLTIMIKNNPLDTCISVLLERITAGKYKINSALEI